MRRRLPLVLAILLGAFLGACGVLKGVPIFPADGGTGDGGAVVDDGGTGDGGAADAGTAWCGQVAPPDAANLCCASCTAGQSGCQANGCYGGWWCDTSACTCVSPSAACGSTSDGGTTTPPGAPRPRLHHQRHLRPRRVHRQVRRLALVNQDRRRPGGGPGEPHQRPADHHRPPGAPSPPPRKSPAGNGMYLPRQAPTETQVWELRDVHLSWDKLEDDSDYHLIVSDGSRSMIVEVPYPGCVTPSSPFFCTITHARHEVEQYLHPTTSAGFPSYTVSLVGVGFFDEIHGQTGVAPNGIELHPVLRICFGRGCNPLQSP